MEVILTRLIYVPAKGIPFPKVIPLGGKIHKANLKNRILK